MRHHLRPPKLKVVTMLFSLAMSFFGCSSSYTVSSAGRSNSEYGYQEMNEELNGRHVTIELKDGEEISAQDVAIFDDSVSWVDASTADKSKMAAQYIKTISFKNHFVGGLEGLGIVSPTVFLGSWGLGGFSSKGIGGSDGWALPAVFGLIGGGIASITGAIVGHSYNYEFLSTTQSDSLQNGR